MEIEGAREVVEAVPLPAGIEATLRRRAKISSAHFSTKIEQNALSYAEVEAVESNANRSRDAGTQEVRNYLRTLQWIHDHAAHKRITSQLFQELHAMIEVRSQGRRPKQSPFRKIQNTVRDDETGAIAYLPPEAKDVGHLAEELARWLNGPAKSLPIPVVAAIAQYQLVTIHPWMDGNGRTSRALGTFLLRKNSYDLKGLLFDRGAVRPGSGELLRRSADESASQLLLRPQRPRPNPLARVLPEEYGRGLPERKGRKCSNVLPWEPASCGMLHTKQLSSILRAANSL